MVVLLLVFPIVSIIAFSEILSRLAVASSKIIRDGFLSKTLAREIRCLSPPERVAPFSPTFVLYLSGSRSIKPSASADFAAQRTSFTE